MKNQNLIIGLGNSGIKLAELFKHNHENTVFVALHTNYESPIAHSNTFKLGDFPYGCSEQAMVGETAYFMYYKNKELKKILTKKYSNIYVFTTLGGRTGSGMIALLLHQLQFRIGLTAYLFVPLPSSNKLIAHNINFAKERVELLEVSKYCIFIETAEETEPENYVKHLRHKM